MKIIIANLDFEDDPHNQAWDSYLRDIRKYNTNGGGVIRIFDPYCEEGKSTLCEADGMFGYGKVTGFNGIIMQCGATSQPYTTWDGYPEIEANLEFEVDPFFMPYLSQNTLVAYMPHIPWDEFGNHMILEGDDAEQFLSLWNTFLKQNRDLFNAVSKGEYPVDTDRSSIGYIFMNKPITL